MTRPLTKGAIWLVALTLLLAAPARAAGPRDELLRLVPEDVGFCLVVQDLRGHAADLLGSPFVKGLADSPFGAKAAASPELKQLAALDRQLQKHFGLDLARLRDDVLGDCVVFAYRPGPPGKPAQEQGLVLLQARDAKLLADLLDRLNKVQKESGDLKELEAREHAGQKYFRRAEKAGTNFYYQRDKLLAFASQEEILHQAIDLEKKGGSGEPAVAKQLRLLGADRQLAALWINPRAFDAEMAANALKAKGAEAAFLTTFAKYWKALDGAALCLDLQKDVRLELAVRADEDKLPAAARRFFSQAAEPSALWGRVPDDALLAVAGRVDAAALFELLGDFLTPADHKALRDGLHRSLGALLGKEDPVKDVLPHLGPDWAFYVTAPPDGDKDWFPHAVLAVAARPGDNKAAPVDQALLSAVDFYAQLAVVAYNQRHADQLVLKTAMPDKDKGKAKYLVNDQLFPPGLRPAYGLENGCLVFASSPEALRDFAARAPGPKAAEVPVLRLSLKELRRFVGDRREPLGKYLAKAHGVGEAEAGRQLDGLLAGLELFDRVEVTQRCQSGQLRLSLRATPARPLK